VVTHLSAPDRPLAGGRRWRWDGTLPWIRIYHAGPGRTATGMRRFGPIDRFDPHTPPYASPRDCPAGRAVTYIADNLRTAAAEVFGEHRVANVCPRYRVAALRPRSATVVQNLRGAGAMMIGGLPAMNVADIPRPETQAWARAIYEDRPSDPRVAGVRYTSAYAGGISLALWDTAPNLEVVARDGVAQDFALADPRIYIRLLVALVPLLVEVRIIGSEECPRC
jgi:hypothetical protein